MIRRIASAFYAPRAYGLYRKYRNSTMIGPVTFVENLLLANHCLRLQPEAFAVVECGTWRGGMAAALIEIGGPKRPYLFFDSFSGLPPAQEIDGESAQKWQSETMSSAYHNNCAATLEEFEATIARVRAVPSSMSVFRGLFEETFPIIPAPPVAVLRLDGDWYASTYLCLSKFWEAVVPGGIILIDDYGTWDGCTRAVHDFLSSIKTPEPILRGPVANVSYIKKR